MTESDKNPRPTISKAQLFKKVQTALESEEREVVVIEDEDKDKETVDSSNNTSTPKADQ